MKFLSGYAVLAEDSPSFIKRLAVGVLLVNLFVIALTVFLLHQSKVQLQERAANATRNLSQVLEQSLDGDLDKIDVALFAVVDEVERQLGEKKAIDEKALNAFLARLQRRLPEVESLRVADARGFLRYGLGVAPGYHGNVIDREYFFRHRDEPNAGLVMQTPPIFARLSKKWAVPVSRRLNWPDGTFAGVVYVNISLDYLTKSLSVIDVGKHGVVTLFDGTLGVIARHPEPQGVGSAVGKKLTSPQIQGLFQEGRSEGTYDAHSTLDGVERTHSYRKVANRPFYVVVGLAMDDYLAEWRDDVIEESALLLLFCLATLLSAWFIYRARIRHLEQSFMLIHQSRLAAMGEMIQNIAHQWRHPLFVLDLLVRNIERMTSAGTLDAQTLEQELREIGLQIREMSSTIDDFRDFFKPNRIKQDFGLLVAIDNTLMLVGRTFDTLGIAVRVERGEEVVVAGYSNELTQVLLNVINNAKDAVLDTEMACGELDISIGHDEKYGWIAVKDNAGGIPDSIMPKIFTPYFSSKESGTGIGLCMSKMIMDHMGGTISARNVDGGAEFTIRLPLAESQRVNFDN